jgi:hypothetical protein
MGVSRYVSAYRNMFMSTWMVVLVQKNREERQRVVGVGKKLKGLSYMDTFERGKG